MVGLKREEYQGNGIGVAGAAFVFPQGLSKCRNRTGLACGILSAQYSQIRRNDTNYVQYINLGQISDRNESERKGKTVVERIYGISLQRFRKKKSSE